MRILRIVFLFVFPVYFISCGTQKKLPPYYLDTVADTSINGQVVIPELRIQKNDLLSIQVYSASTRPELSDVPFNLPEATAANGFLVDMAGNIEYPRLGTIRAEGLTKQQLADVIRKKLTEPVELLRNPSVVIRFLNYKVTVLGQVVREGQVSVVGEKLTILEAIGHAGGITDYGKKERIKIVREVDGKRNIGYIDLSTDSLFHSPYYNLLQNDVVIVEPTKQKARMTDQTIVSQRISLALGIITSAAFIYNIFK